MSGQMLSNSLSVDF